MPTEHHCPILAISLLSAPSCLLHPLVPCHIDIVDMTQFLALSLGTIIALFASSSSAGPIPASSSAASLRRQTYGPYVIVNEGLDTVLTPWTQQQQDGVPVGIAQYLAALNQFWYPILTDDGDYQIMNAASASWSSPLYLSTVQTTSSDGYAPGYNMLQLNSVPTTFSFSLTAVSDNYNINPLDGSNTTLNFYQYDDPTRIWIPVVSDAFYDPAANEAWEFLEQTPPTSS